MDALPHRLAHFRAPALLFGTNPRRLPNGARVLLQSARTLMALAAMALVSACGGPRAHDGAAVVPTRKAPASGIISPGDTLRLAFRKLPELNQSQRVRADGRVSLLQIGSVRAAGK